MATTKKETAPAVDTTPVQADTTPVQETPAVPAAEERVEVFIPKGYANDEPNLFVGVNGKSFLLPKGKKSVVPKYIADEIERSRKAEETQDERVAEMTAAASK